MELFKCYFLSLSLFLSLSRSLSFCFKLSVVCPSWILVALSGWRLYQGRAFYFCCSQWYNDDVNNDVSVWTVKVFHSWVVHSVLSRSWRRNPWVERGCCWLHLIFSQGFLFFSWFYPFLRSLLALNPSKTREHLPHHQLKKKKAESLFCASVFCLFVCFSFIYFSFCLNGQCSYWTHRIYYTNVQDLFWWSSDIS